MLTHHWASSVRTEQFVQPYLVYSIWSKPASTAKKDKRVSISDIGAIMWLHQIMTPCCCAYRTTALK